MTGSAIAIPLMGASGASAASGAVWDKVAECESGGFWSADTGNGYHGGLQLSQEDWEKYGGLDYAPSADQASRSQQIAVAEKVLADRGADVWRICGLLHGLGEESTPADVDTGVGGESSDSSDSSVEAAEGSTKAGIGLNGSGAGTSRDADSADAGADAGADVGADVGVDTSTDAGEAGSSDSSGQSGDSAADGEGTGHAGTAPGSGSESDTSGTGRHRGASASEGAAEGRTDGAAGSTGRHAFRGGDSARGADVTDDSYTVRTGDSLWAIADSLDLEGGWPELYAANKETVGADPDLIFPGQRLDVALETGPGGVPGVSPGA